MYPMDRDSIIAVHRLAELCKEAEKIQLLKQIRGDKLSLVQRIITWIKHEVEIADPIPQPMIDIRRTTQQNHAV